MVRLAGRHDWNERPVGLWISRSVPQPLARWILRVPGRAFVVAPLWLAAWYVAAAAEFGVVFVVASALVAMYLNTSTDERSPDSLSAYSVFNKNLTRIAGTTDPDAIDRELRGKMY